MNEFDKIWNETMGCGACDVKPCEDWYDVPSDEMTFEQARQAVKDLRKKLAEYLEQQPCEDCVSREDVKSEMIKYGFLAPDMTVTEFVEYLPSVKPQRPKGRWIEQTDKNKKLYGWFYCSECGAVLGRVDGANYCSECGAEMEGEEC